ncbi:site-specific recombinase XerD [Nitrosomonas oligotropha]|uniref:Site-specific recombinase XerD n=1 Tax=Nitrosomonas oligotropha TaxID=42354 RepID=A0A2T5I0X5_9PROT|nr:site-specific integrase [Nitrosomonas oligotropha]PTQ77398.1 site-specific recombinase XerD [Nitrosomonas oligotropha]
MKKNSILNSHGTRKKVHTYLAATQAKNTQLAYQSDIAHFLKSGGKIPATPHCVASYLAIYANTLSPATLTRRVVAIGHAHKDKGLASPTRSALVADTLRGIRRINGSKQRQVMPLLKIDLVKITRKLTGLIGLRDKALLLTGFAGAFRRSELVALQVEDVRFVTEGALINVRRSKTDQNGVGRKVAIPYIKGRHCPVRALKTWLEKSGIKTGALFRRMNRFDQVTDYGLCAASVALIVKQRVRDAGLNPEQYSGHSLRAGLVTSAAQAGVSSWKIRQQTAHKSDLMLQRYIRDSQLFVNNAVSQIW